MDALADVSGRYKIEDFDAAALRPRIEHDIRVFEEMLSLVEPITPEEDDKLRTLRKWLERPELRDGKRLIFTQYADTAQYLYEQLDPTDDNPKVEVIYSQQKNRATVVGRFAPAANPQHRPPEGTPEIDTLVATDVLAEGLNLQDCDKVINYDLHWNPVRLIQRLGRVDRIGSQFDVVYAYNFLPETELDKNLGLQAKLQRRIREIHETIGEDAAILDPTEQLNEEAMYTIYTQGEIGRYEEDDVDEFVDLNEAAEIVRQLKEDQPNLYEHIVGLKDGIRSGRPAGQEGTVVFCRSGRYRQLFLVDEEGDVITREIPRILGLLDCEPDTPTEPLPEGYSDIVMGIRQQFEREVRERRAEQRHTVSLTRAQRYVLRELRLLYGQADDADLRQQIAVLEAAFRQPAPLPAVRGELNRIKREGIAGEALLALLTKVYHLHGLDRAPKQDEDALEDNDSLPRIVCSEALVTNG